MVNPASGCPYAVGHGMPPNPCTRGLLSSPPLLHFTRRRTKLTHSECLATESEAEHTEMSGPARTPGPTSFSLFLFFFLSFFLFSITTRCAQGRSIEPSTASGPPVDRVFGSVGLRPSRRPPRGTGLAWHILCAERD